MSFSVSNNIITQTGTDTDLTGLAGVAGVTVTTVAGVSIYNIANNRFLIEGTLTIDPEVNMLVSTLTARTDGVIRVNSGGTLNLGVEVTSNNFTRVTQGLAILSNGGASSSAHNSEILLVVSGGTLNIRGATIRTIGTIGIEDGATLLVDDGVIETGQPVRIFTASCTIDKLLIIGSPALFYRRATLIRGLSVVHSVSSQTGRNGFGILVYGPHTGATTNNTIVEFDGYTLGGNIRDFAVVDEGKVRIKNTEQGSSLTFVAWLIAWSGDANRSQGYAQFAQDIQVNVIDSDGAIAGATVFIEDTDNGSRTDARTYLSNNTDIVDDRITKQYATTTNSSGVATIDNVITAIAKLSTGTETNGNATYDYRGKVNDSTDRFDVLIASYGHLIKCVETTLKSEGRKTLTELLEVDPAITATDTTDVAAYTELDTANKLYDALKLYKVNNITATTGRKSQLISASGTQLTVLSGWTLIRDETISAAYSVDTTNRIIRVKTGAGGLLATSSFTTITGSIHNSFDGNTSLLYVRSNGKVVVEVNITAETGITDTVFSIWPASQGMNNRANILTAPSTGVILATPSTDYYIIADGINAIRSEPEVISSGPFGATISIPLTRFKFPNGTNILPNSISTAQSRIANMFSINGDIIDITLPSDYATDPRWDATSKTWSFTSDDFIAIAYRLDLLQSRQAQLDEPSTILISNATLTFETNSPVKFRQKSTNVSGAVININAFTIRREGDSSQSNTFVDHSNGSILTNAGNPVIATVSTPETVLTEVTNTIPARVEQATTVAKLSGMIETATDGSGDSFTTEALENSPAGGGGGGSLNTNQNTILTGLPDNIEDAADRVINAMVDVE